MNYYYFFFKKKECFYLKSRLPRRWTRVMSPLSPPISCLNWLNLLMRTAHQAWFWISYVGIISFYILFRVKCFKDVVLETEVFCSRTVVDIWVYLTQVGYLILLFLNCRFFQCQLDFKILHFKVKYFNTKKFICGYCGKVLKSEIRSKAHFMLQ